MPISIGKSAPFTPNTIGCLNCDSKISIDFITKYFFNSTYNKLRYIDIYLTNLALQTKILILKSHEIINLFFIKKILNLINALF